MGKNSLLLVLWLLLPVLRCVQAQPAEEPLLVEVTLKQYDSLLLSYGSRLGDRWFLEKLTYQDCAALIRLRNTINLSNWEYPDLPKRVRHRQQWFKDEDVFNMMEYVSKVIDLGPAEPHKGFISRIGKLRLVGLAIGHRYLILGQRRERKIPGS
jgi:hypothetical protein